MMNIKRLAAIALLSGVLTAYGTPGEASLITWDFTSTPSTSSGGSLYFTVSGVTVTVSAWGLTGNNYTTFETAQAILNTTYGLGSCNTGDGCAAGNTTGAVTRVDNIGQRDFILFQASAPVDWKSIVIDPGGASYDRDVSYWVGNLNGGLAGKQLSDLSTILGFGSVINVPNSTGSSALAPSLTGNSVTSLLIGTYAGATTGSFTAGDDRFYIKSLTDDALAPVATPEPGTLLLLGSGLVGVAAFGRRLRKRG